MFSVLLTLFRKPSRWARERGFPGSVSLTRLDESKNHPRCWFLGDSFLFLADGVPVDVIQFPYALIHSPKNVRISSAGGSYTAITNVRVQILRESRL